MRDTAYFRQIPKYTVEPSALTNHLLHESCVTEKCIQPLTAEKVERICAEEYPAETCNKIISTCNGACLPMKRGCASTEVDGTSCMEYYSRFNQKS